MIVPCRDCTDRSPMCHVTCGRYSEYNAENEKRRKKRWLDMMCAFSISRWKLMRVKQRLEKQGRKW